MILHTNFNWNYRFRGREDEHSLAVRILAPLKEFLASSFAPRRKESRVLGRWMQADGCKPLRRETETDRLIHLQLATPKDPSVRLADDFRRANASHRCLLVAIPSESPHVCSPVFYGLSLRFFKTGLRHALFVYIYHTESTQIRFSRVLKYLSCLCEK